jgi:allophanate hydrolase
MEGGGVATAPAASNAGMLDITDMSIERVQSLYQRRSATPTDVVRAVYAKISAYPDKAVWITLVSEAEALKRAGELELQQDRPALYGIPFSVKDSIDVAGMPTTVACPSYAYTATKTAPVVQRILDAGGVLIGKTNLDQLATGLNGTRSPYGIPRCVHDSEYISGGSSSGSVVSVAAGLVSFTVGTDTAGSTRVPAALNGVVGLKPTLGTISAVGLVPACKNADCVTVLAPTVDSAVQAWDVMRFYDEDDAYARDPLQLAALALQPAWSSARTTIKYGLPPPSLVESALSPEYSKMFHRFLSRMTRRGNDLSPGPTFDYSPFAAANAMLYGSSIVSQRIVAFKDYLDAHGYGQLHPVIRDIFAASDGFDAVRAYQDIFSLAEYRRLASKQFTSPDGVDVLIVPSTATHPLVSEMLADPVDLNKRLGSFTHFVNLLDLCAVSVPLSATWQSKNGKPMPFGVTLISTPGRDREILELGRRIMAMPMD